MREYWGYEAFRPKQQEVVESILAGHDVAVVMPTGGGKSLCYQLPAVVSGRLCVVISPLIALMQDQASQLAQLGVPAAVLNSSQDQDQRKEVFRKLYRNELKLIYLSPERLAVPSTTEWLSQCNPGFFAVDEAHCISEWGHEFRPEYRQLQLLRDKFPDAPIAAFTASATRKVRHDILTQLKLREPRTFITSFARRNLRYFIRESAKKDKEKLLLRAGMAQATRRLAEARQSGVDLDAYDAVDSTGSDQLTAADFEAVRDMMRREASFVDSVPPRDAA